MLRSELFPVTAFLCSLALVIAFTCCAQGTAKPAVDVGIRIADGVCTEEAKQPNEPEWVAIACAIEGGASGVAHVVMQRSQWDVVRGRKAPPCSSTKPSTFDAGPGK